MHVDYAFDLLRVSLDAGVDARLQCRVKEPMLLGHVLAQPRYVSREFLGSDLRLKLAHAGEDTGPGGEPNA